jgi:CheY-like chemotaxis protein
MSDSSILLVEDSADDVFFMQRAWRNAGIAHSLNVVTDGQQALNYISGAGEFSDRSKFPLPAIILLDLKLPLVLGMDVLRWVKNQPALKSIVVIVLTSSTEQAEVDRAYRLGANSYLVKPPQTRDLADLVNDFKRYWLAQAKLPSSRESHAVV